VLVLVLVLVLPVVLRGAACVVLAAACVVPRCA
jgi:hypothetical protein